MTIEEKIKSKLAEHGLALNFFDKVEGGAVTLYRYEPEVGLKMSKIESYAKDIEQVVETSGVRILAPIPDSGLVGFEVPAKKRVFPKGKAKSQGFNIVIGVNIYGDEITIDIRQAPHVLAAGASGGGKSTLLGSMIRQLKKVPECDIILLDPKMVELSEFVGGNADTYADNPHSILKELQALVAEMENRYRILQKAKKKNIAGTELKYKFAFIDEFGDLIAGSTLSSEIKKAILLLAQKGRAAGIHMILATQRPSAKIIDGDIKANFPTRVAFRTATSVDSQVILDQSGAEKLLGKGDLLLKTEQGLIRLQGYEV